MKITDADLIRLCQERAASYGALRATAPTAIALDAAASRLATLTPAPGKGQRPAKAPLIVWSPDGDTPPKVAHQTHGSAHRAAHQLAAKHPGRTFYVMERSGRPVSAASNGGTDTSGTGPRWDHRFRRLNAGETILATDECQRDDGSWVPAVSVGGLAPDPNYTSHRVYRRILINAPVTADRRYLSDRFKWAAPGDRQHDVWIVRFDDADVRDMVFEGLEAEGEAWAAWERHAPGYNIRVFRLAALFSAPAEDAELPDSLPGHWDGGDGAAIARACTRLSRSTLCKGDLSDMALANAVYLAGRDDLDLIVWQTAAKERIRWLSAQLAAAIGRPCAVAGEEV